MTDETVYSFRNVHVPTSFTFVGESHSEMLRLSEDGFYVRGVKLETLSIGVQDEHEARKVYEAFRDWLKEMGKL